jgi:hypothetical protein
MERPHSRLALSASDNVKVRVARRALLDVTDREFALLTSLRTPQAIQTFLNAIPTNHEMAGETMWSVREVIRHRRAHCMEGALLAACALWVHGEPPLVMHLDCASSDYPHVVALFRRAGSWGAISKTNGVALRFRDPIYRSLRELAMSYFHEYCDGTGRRTLRRYSVGFDMRRIEPSLWVTNPGPCLATHDRLAALRHYELVSRRQLRLVSRRDPFERRLAKIAEYPRVLRKAR